MANWLTGMLQGFSGRKAEIEKQNLEMAWQSRQREGQILETLIQSPDPETRSLAIAGLLESARPGKRKSGLAGWVGQLEQSPYLGRIRGLSPTVRQQVSVPDVPTQQGYVPDAAPKAQPAAQTTTNPTVQGPDGAPLSEVQPLAGASTSVVGTAPPDSPIMPDVRAMAQQAAGTPPPRTTLAVERQRQTYPTAIDLARQEARAQAMGKVEGGVAGFEAAGGNPEAYRAALLQQMERGVRGTGAAAPYQVVPGEAFNPDTGKWEPAYASFNKATNTWTQAASDGSAIGEPITQFRPRPAASSVAGGQRGFGTTREAAAQDLYQQSFGEVAQGVRAGTLPPDALTRVLTREQAITAALAGATTTARGTAEATAPLSTQQRVQLTSTLSNEWQQYSSKWRDMQDSLGQMGAAIRAAERGDIAQGTEAIGTLWQKMLDPVSVVREAEAKRPQGFQPLLTRWDEAWQQLLRGGGGMPLAQLQNYYRLASEMAVAVGKATAGQRTMLTLRAQDGGVDPQLIFSPADPGQSATGVGAPPPTAGTAGAARPLGARQAGPPPSRLDLPAPAVNGQTPIIRDGQLIYQ